MTRRGFTLIEQLVALALLSVVMAAVGPILLASRRSFQTYMARIAIHQTLQAAATVLPAELRELDAADSDIVAMSANAITVRAARTLTFLCAAPEVQADGALRLIVRELPWFDRAQPFDAGDSLLLYAEGEPGTSSDDRWVGAEVVATSSRGCPDRDGAHPGWELTLRQGWSRGGSVQVESLTIGAPVRGFAITSYAVYRSSSDGRWYLGVRVPGSVIEPLVGPLAGPDGVTFAYADSAGGRTDRPTAVAQIEIRVHAGSPPSLVDSVVTRVALRNNRRPR